MINLIPKPQKAKELGIKINFSTKTTFCGEFLETINLFSHLIPVSTDAENMTFFERKEIGFRKNWFFDVDYEYNIFKDLTK